MGDSTSAVPRRTVAKGAAWSVPAVAVAAATPSLAASTDCKFGLNVTGEVTYFRDDFVDMHLYPTLTDSGCPDGTTLTGDLTVSFTLDSSAYTGTFFSPYDLTGGKGTDGTYTYSRTMNDTTVPSTPQDAPQIIISFWLVPGSENVPVTFTVSGPGVVAPASVTVSYPAVSPT